MNRAIGETIDVAGRHGFPVESLHDGRRYRLKISEKRCQIIRCRAVSIKSGSGFRTFIPLFLPKSAWAEFLILFVRADVHAASERFYVLPRAKVKKRTMLSTSGWLQGFANGWHLLSHKAEPSHCAGGDCSRPSVIANQTNGARKLISRGTRTRDSRDEVSDVLQI
jgi:hypothetical protein